MNDHQTSVLADRLHRLADDMTPPLDVVGMVRDARAVHQRRRRGRIALVAVATATAAVVVGTATAVDLLSADRSGEVATPAVPTPTIADPSPGVTPSVSQAPAAEPTSDAPMAPAATLPDGEHFAFVTSAEPSASPVPGVVGELTVQVAEWLGSGPDDFSCLDGQEFPLNVSEFCVGVPEAAQVLHAADGPYELHPSGNPFRTVDFEEFRSVVAYETNIPEGPTMGWLTIRGGVVVAFEEVTEQAA